MARAECPGGAVCSVTTFKLSKDSGTQEQVNDHSANLALFEELVGPTLAPCFLEGSDELITSPEQVPIKDAFKEVAGKYFIFHGFQAAPPVHSATRQQAACNLTTSPFASTAAAPSASLASTISMVPTSTGLPASTSSAAPAAAPAAAPTQHAVALDQTRPIAEEFGPLHWSTQQFLGDVLRVMMGVQLGFDEAYRRAQPALEPVLGELGAADLHKVVSLVRVYAPCKALMNGAVAADPPGIGTANPEHDRITSTHLRTEVTHPLVLQGLQPGMSAMALLTDKGGYLDKVAEAELSAAGLTAADNDQELQPGENAAAAAAAAVSAAMPASGDGEATSVTESHHHPVHLARQAPVFVRYLENQMSGTLSGMGNAPPRAITLAVVCQRLEEIKQQNSQSAGHIQGIFKGNLASSLRRDYQFEPWFQEADWLEDSTGAAPTLGLSRLLNPQVMTIYPALLESMRLDPSYSSDPQLLQMVVEDLGGTPEQVREYMEEDVERLLNVIIGTPHTELLTTLRRVRDQIREQQGTIQAITAALGKCDGKVLRLGINGLDSKPPPADQAALEEGVLRTLHARVEAFCRPGAGPAHGALSALLGASNMEQVLSRLAADEEAEKGRLWSNLTVCLSTRLSLRDYTPSLLVKLMLCAECEAGVCWVHWMRPCTMAILDDSCKPHCHRRCTYNLLLALED
jgi:hypothetical protein